MKIGKEIANPKETEAILHEVAMFFVNHLYIEKDEYGGITIKARNGKCGLLFRGVCGNGKTTVIKAIQQVFNHWMDRGYLKRISDGMGGYTNGLGLKDSNEIVAKSVNNQEWLIDYRALKMIAIDDFGNEPAEIMHYGSILRPITDLISYRYNNELMTIISTNLNGEEIKNKYGVRIYDRLKEMCVAITFRDQSYRK